MPRVHRSIDDIHHEFSDDFTVVNGNLLLCKFCDTIVKWRKKTRVIEHMSTRMHAERKEAKLKRLLQVYTFIDCIFSKKYFSSPVNKKPLQ